MLRFLIYIGLLTACSAAPVVPADVTDESLTQGASSGVAAAAGAQVLIVDDAGLARVDGFGARTALRTGTSTLHDASALPGMVLAAVDDTLLLITQTGAEPSPLGDLLSGPITGVHVRPDVQTLATASGIFLVRNGTIDEVLVGGAPVTGRGRLAPDGTLWLATQDGGIALRGGTLDAWVDGPVVDVAVADDGAAWFAEDRTLTRIDPDGLDRVRVPEPVTRLHASPDGLWVLTDTHSYHLVDGELLDGGALPADLNGSSVDSAGRLLLSSPEGAVRRAIGRPILIDGMPSDGALATRIDVGLHPTAADRVTGLVASIDGAELAVVNRLITLDPTQLEGGDHVLSVTATWDDGVEVEQSVDFRTTFVGIATWQDDIGPLNEARCALCHAGDSATVLDGPDAWQDNFDDILAAVTESRMPLSGDPLDALDIARLRAWQTNGFARQ